MVCCGFTEAVIRLALSALVGVAVVAVVVCYQGPVLRTLDLIVDLAHPGLAVIATGP